MKTPRLLMAAPCASIAAWLFLVAAPAFVTAQTPPPAAPRSPELPADAKVLLDLAYVENGHPQQKLDLYLPAQPKGPLLVWIHGGGWTSGDRKNPLGLPLVKNGVAVASIEYRLSQQAIFPAQLEDCKAAIRWLRAHAQEYGYRGDLVAAWGASAGGHLVALLAVTGQVRDFDVGANLDQSSAIQCGLDWFGPTDFLHYNVNQPGATIQPESPGSVLAQLLGGPVSQKLELAKRASPVTWATKTAAPLLIMQGTKDPLVPFDQSQRLYDKLKSAGADVTLDVVEGAGHGGPQFMAPEKIKLMLEFLTKHWSR